MVQLVWGCLWSLVKSQGQQSDFIFESLIKPRNPNLILGFTDYSLLFKKMRIALIKAPAT